MTPPRLSRQYYQPHSRAALMAEAPHRAVDAPTLLMVLMLLATGLIALFTASYANALYNEGKPLYYIQRQLIFAGMGIIVMWLVSKVNYRIYGALQKPLFAISLALMAVTPFVGTGEKGAVRWINLGSFGFQPSEIMKLSIILSFAYYASRPNAKIRKFSGLFPYIAALGATAVCLKLQNHMSATIIIFMLGFIILYVAGIRLWYFIPLGVAASVGAYWYVMHSEHIIPRLQVWLDPFIDVRNTGWQGAMSIIAIGSGGLFGMGLGQGRQKHLLLPEPQNDFIFSNFCEELGLIGALLVIVMFAYLIFRGFYIARSSRDKFACLLAVGITSKLAIQTLLNMCVVSGVMPITGASLPFFSYGGTALLLQMFEMGVLLNISKFMQPDHSE